MYLRQTRGYLPEAEVAFVDEIFKANSAILNSLLTLLNERLFDNGADRLPVPLTCLVQPLLNISLSCSVCLGVVVKQSGHVVSRDQSMALTLVRQPRG